MVGRCGSKAVRRLRGARRRRASCIQLGREQACVGLEAVWRSREMSLVSRWHPSWRPSLPSLRTGHERSPRLLTCTLLPTSAALVCRLQAAAEANDG